MKSVHQTTAIPIHIMTRRRNPRNTTTMVRFIKILLLVEFNRLACAFCIILLVFCLLRMFCADPKSCYVFTHRFIHHLFFFFFFPRLPQSTSTNTSMRHEHEHEHEHEHKHDHHDHSHGHCHDHSDKKEDDDIPAWKKKAMESSNDDPMAAPFGGSWNMESSVDATADKKPKMKE